jgi:alpha-D-xyloside xylohydrolase
MNFPLQPAPPRRLAFDVESFLRLDALQSVGTSASGAEFATSTGDILEVSCYGPGVFRLRAGPNTRPDYGLLVGRTKACTSARDGGAWRFTTGETTLELLGSPLAFRLLHRGAPVLASITDEQIGGTVRLPAFGRLRKGSQWMASLALASDEPVYGLGEKFGPLDKRGQLVHSQVVDALGVNTGNSYKNTPFAWSPGTGKGAWGVFAHTPSLVTHGVGHPDWSHRSYVLQIDDDALDLFVLAADTPAAIVDLYTQLTGRPAPVPSWSLGLWVSRAYYKTPAEAAQTVAKFRERKIPCDVLTLGGRAAWDVGTAFDFTWDPARFSDPRAALAAIKAHHVRVCVWEYPYVSVHSPLFVDLASRSYLLMNCEGDPYVFAWDRAPELNPFGDREAPLPDSGIVDFTHPGAYVYWRDAHAALFADGVDVFKSDFGEHVPEDAVAFNGDSGRRLHNVYPLLYNRCVRDATEKYQPDRAAPPMVWGRAGWTGSQRCPVQWGGEPQSDWEGLAASIRGALSWGMSGAPYYSSDIGGFYGEPPTPELYVGGCRPRCSRRTWDFTRRASASRGHSATTPKRSRANGSPFVTG